MKKFVISLVLLGALTGLIIFHSVTMINFGEKAAELNYTIKQSAEAEDWETVRENLESFDGLWEKMRKFAVLTVRTNVIEEIDISLEQCKTHAKNEVKPDFLSECIMLKQLIHHIAYQEGLHIEEIL